MGGNALNVDNKRDRVCNWKGHVFLTAKNIRKKEKSYEIF